MVLLAVSLYTSKSVILIGTVVVGTAGVGMGVAVGVAVGVPAGWVVQPLSKSIAPSITRTDRITIDFCFFQESVVMKYRISSWYIIEMNEILISW